MRGREDMNWSMHALFITRQKTQLADRKLPTAIGLYSVLTLSYWFFGRLDGQVTR